MAVVQCGSGVVALVTKAIDQLKTGNSTSAMATLSRLESDAGKLSSETQDLLQQLTDLQDYYKTEIADATRMIASLSLEKDRLENQISSAKIELQQREDRHASLRRQLSVAESNRDSARRERDNAESNKNAMIGTAVGVGVAGVALSILTFGIAAPVAVAATTACGLSAAEYADKEEAAKRDIGRYNSELSSVGREIDENRSRISSIENKVRDLYRRIGEQERKCATSQDHKQHVQEAIAFLQECQCFWGKFATNLDHRSSKTKRLHRLLQMAEEKKERSFFKHRGSQTMVMSFIDAWERFRQDIQSGSSECIFSVTFTCARCKQKMTSLPFIMNKQLTCASCHRAIE